MSALSDHKTRQRQQRIASAQTRVAAAQRYLSTRPQATGSDHIRNLVEATRGLLEEIAIGDIKA